MFLMYDIHGGPEHRAVRSTEQWTHYYDLLCRLPYFFLHPTHIMFGQSQNMLSIYIVYEVLWALIPEI